MSPLRPTTNNLPNTVVPQVCAINRCWKSPLVRPHNLVAYGTPDIADLAASYAYGIARNPPFVDGNKRTALVVSETFLALAAGELDMPALADWFHSHIA